MLEMIFASSDFPEYDYFKSNENNYKVPTIPKYRVEVDEDILKVTINVNDDEPDWGYYIDLDTSTPPTINYSKNKNSYPTTLNLPKKNYNTATKPIKYLPVIEEDIIKTNHNTRSYITDEISSSTSTVISGVTFCATVAFYYFFRSIRNN